MQARAHCRQLLFRCLGHLLELQVQNIGYTVGTIMVAPESFQSHMERRIIIERFQFFRHLWTCSEYGQHHRRREILDGQRCNQG